MGIPKMQWNMGEYCITKLPKGSNWQMSIGWALYKGNNCLECISYYFARLGSASKTRCLISKCPGELVTKSNTPKVHQLWLRYKKNSLLFPPSLVFISYMKRRVAHR